MAFRNLQDYVKIDPAFGYFAAGSTNINSTGFNMKGYEGILAAIQLGDVTTGAAVNLHAEMSTAVGGTYVDAANSAAYFSSTQGSSSLWLICEVTRPSKDFVRFVIDRDEATNIQILGGLALRYNAGSVPVAESTYSAVIDYSLVVNPSSGSATG